VIGDDLAERGIADRIQTTAEDPPSRLASDNGPAEGALRSVGDGLIATFWVLLITATALLDGRRVRRGLRSLSPSHRHEQFDRVDQVFSSVIARYAVGSVVVAAIAGMSTFAIAIVGGVPLAPLIGLWAGLTNLIPQVGGYLGMVPLVVLALTTGTTKGADHRRGLRPLHADREPRHPASLREQGREHPAVRRDGGGADRQRSSRVVGAILVTPLIAVAISLRKELGSAGSTPARSD
jgi:hypothetical protein